MVMRYTTMAAQIARAGILFSSFAEYRDPHAAYVSLRNIQEPTRFVADMCHFAVVVLPYASRL